MAPKKPPMGPMKPPPFGKGGKPPPFPPKKK